ncbi:hypothetical protein THICB1_10199 [Thiomonas arsenitoxydans]|uniref:Nucleotidyl transferase AbiEii/AbiGii toxin family protein n=1 Tax=Thiomonas arsenitoxydans (strain DSM 22701 / CIP 110005 / 3As) TaxID=426114 RepID=A0ABM9SZG9_THIA3|nr:hypothetical protein THICB1_10199 [Thiomonas arsenitoxydans]
MTTRDDVSQFKASGPWRELARAAAEMVADAEQRAGSKMDPKLGGGTRLMLAFEHRISDDIDLFIRDPQWIGYLTPRLNDRFESVMTGYEESATALKLRLPAGEIDFIVSMSLLGLPDEHASDVEVPFALEPVDEVLAKKLFYRGWALTPRDLFDWRAVVAHSAAGHVAKSMQVFLPGDRLDAIRESLHAMTTSRAAASGMGCDPRSRQASVRCIHQVGVGTGRPLHTLSRPQRRAVGNTPTKSGHRPRSLSIPRPPFSLPLPLPGRRAQRGCCLCCRPRAYPHKHTWGLSWQPTSLKKPNARRANSFFISAARARKSTSSTPMPRKPACGPASLCATSLCLAASCALLPASMKARCLSYAAWARCSRASTQKSPTGRMRKSDTTGRPCKPCWSTPTGSRAARMKATSTRLPECSPKSSSCTTSAAGGSPRTTACNTSSARAAKSTRWIATSPVAASTWRWATSI